MILKRPRENWAPMTLNRSALDFGNWEKAAGRLYRLTSRSALRLDVA